jgi:hypothetical protein
LPAPTTQARYVTAVEHNLLPHLGDALSPVVRFVMSAILSSPQCSAADHQIMPVTQSL